MTNSLTSLSTPCLLLERRKFESNLARMEAALPPGVDFRPHLKTAKSEQVARHAMRRFGARATVSTLREAEVFGAQGLTDLLYGVAITPDKLPRVEALHRRGIDLKLVVDSPSMAREIAEYGREKGLALPVLVELDLDGHRGGVAPEDHKTLLAIGRELRQPGARLAGVMAHAGSSYDLPEPESLRAAAGAEAEAARRAADILRDAGMECGIVSIGSTPTALHATSLEGITEIRAGVFMFFDLVQAGIGVCNRDEIALSVLATVISADLARGRLVVDAGWMALSRDRGTASQSRDFGYGQVCDIHGRVIDGLIVADAQQEHGILGMQDDAALPELAVGTRLRILPNHACATAAQHSGYHLAGDGDTTEFWPRFSGW